MTVLEQGNITIHTENIFPIIKKSLYSGHEVFFRELMSNAVDAITKMRMVSFSEEFKGDVGEPEIIVEIDKNKNTLSISDNGIGMTADEVKKYINQVAFSSAEEFLQKYKSAGEQIIGHFGLGFYSSFMVASKVEIDTLSYREGAQAVHWSCDGSPSFILEDSSRTTRGTTVTLHLLEEEKEYTEVSRIKQLVKTYCDFMPVPIKLNGEVINKQKSPWRQSPNELTKEDYLEFYRYLYPFQDEPLLWVHLKTDYPFDISGILYFPKLRPDLDVTKGEIKLYCNHVFVSEHVEEIIPKFLLPMRGVIDSPDIPLNVSRSALQVDRTVRKIADFVAKKVGDRLNELYKQDWNEYVRCWQDIGTFVKFGCLNDDKFKKQVNDIVIFRTTADLSKAEPETPAVEVQSEAGDAWQDVTPKNSKGGTQWGTYTTLQDYLDRNKERHKNRVFYATDEAQQATYIQLHKNQGLEVLIMDSFIDTHFISFLEREHTDVKFSRVDSEIDDKLLDKNQEKEIVDPTTKKTRSEQIKEIFEKALNKPKVNIRTEALKSDDPQGSPPAMILLPEFVRRIQDMTALMSQEAAKFPEEHILLVNTAHPLIKNLAQLSSGSIIQADGTSPTGELVNMICQHIYDLALIAQKGFDAEKMKAFVQRSSQVLTALSDRATK